MKNTLMKVMVIAVMLVICAGIFSKPVKAMAADETAIETSVSSEDSVRTSKAWGAGIMMAVAAGLGALSMGIVIAKCADGIARQPEAEGKIRTTMMLGLVFVETAIIYALIVAILIIFVL